MYALLNGNLICSFDMLNYYALLSTYLICSLNERVHISREKQADNHFQIGSSQYNFYAFLHAVFTSFGAHIL